ncbi:MAG TPA: phosphatidate cytidylyltransferase [Acidimicrobiales bacterium]|nr:phosphatidate cytidylyltransferase [Acidimicrobiales bacterium]
MDSENHQDGEEEEAPPTPRKVGEGVRIIGADEAAAALQAGQAAGRRPEDQPRFGDVPPHPEGPRPALRFPLPDSGQDVPRPQVSPAVGRPGPEPVPEPTGTDETLLDTPVPVASDEPLVAPGGDHDLLHWTEPPTGEVPPVLAAASTEQEDDLDAWSGFASRAPRWREGRGDWDEADFEDASALAEESRLGAAHVPDDDADPFAFDREAEEEEVRQLTAVVSTPPPAWRAPSGGSGLPPEVPRRTPPLPRAGTRTRVLTGVGIGVLALLLFKAGTAPAMVLVTLVATLAAAEGFGALRRSGYRPATLLGLTATVAVMVGAYLKGETALPLVLSMTLVFGFLWYLAGVVRARPTVNLGATLLGFVWVGFLASYAGLMLDPNVFPARHGIAFLLGALIGAVGYDVGGFVFGSQLGRHPMAPAISPNKTWEGLFGGMLTALLASAVIAGQIHPWTLRDGVALGLVVAVVAPLGDLCESLIKRDLGLKDMGTVLPGHGGLLDRVDAILFVLPATYYLVRVLGIG